MRVMSKFPLFAWGLVVALISALLFGGCGGGGGVTTPISFTVGGAVINLAGAGGGLMLQDNGGDTVMVNANGAFQFPTPLISGSSYKVTVSAQPSNPVQSCAATSASGIVSGDVSSIKVDCGHKEWAWQAGFKTADQIGVYGTMGVAAPGNTPGGRQYPATWTDASGNLWLFGGYGHDSGGNLLPFNDLWKFSGGQWTWISGPMLAGANGVYGTLGVASPNNIPGARFEPASWTDSAGNLWMFGGNGFDSVGNESPMNDLWKYSAGEWTWMGGSSIGLQQGVYGTLGVASASNMPGGRSGTVIWLDASGNLWLFGGLGYDEFNPVNGELSDLWKYSGGEWTWMGGPKDKQQVGVYGTEGIAASSNLPGARWGAFNWVDAGGNFWLFGGYGYDVNGSVLVLNDQWKYSSGQWTWVAGAKVVDQPGVYGTQGVAAANNIPGARWFGATWTDAAGNAWIFGGNGFDSTGQAGFLNDLWKFSGGQWTWMGGANAADPPSAFGTQGILFPGNGPGGRFFLARWVDTQGNFWLFGGYGEASGPPTGNLNDMWMYEP